MAWLPDFDDVMEIHFALAEQFLNDEDPISPAGSRDDNLVHSACMRPHTGIGDKDKYETEYQKIAALFHSLTQNHAFHNGNKRTALVSMLASLYRNGRILNYELDDDEVYEMTVSVAKGSFLHSHHRLEPDIAVEKISNWLRSNTVSRNYTASDMIVADFISRCEGAGCSHKESNGYHHISYRDKGIRIGLDTRRIAGNVAKTYLRRLGISLEESGQTFAEFQNVDEAERENIYRFMSVLRRLAKI